MSEISSITTDPATAALTTATSNELDMDAFLRLLTVQLQHQDPLDPLSSDEFVAQLAQFSSLEELVGMQSSLDAVYLAVASMNNASMAGLLGTEVVAVGDTFAYDGEGDVTLHYDAAAPVSSGTVTVTDETGKVVATFDLGAAEQGEGTIVWDGKDLNGQPVPAGEYSFSIEATGADGESVDVTTLVVGTITEMDYATGVPQPAIEGVPVDLAAIVRITSGDGS